MLNLFGILTLKCSFFPSGRYFFVKAYMRGEDSSMLAVDWRSACSAEDPCGVFPRAEGA